MTEAMARGFLSWMRTRGLMLAMLALVLKAAIPAGFMVAEAQGAPQIVLCTGHGAMVLDQETGALTPLDQSGQHNQGQSDDGQVQSCPFAALAFAAPAPSPVALPMARAPPERLLAATTLVVAATTLAGPPLPARGPPLNA